MSWTAVEIREPSCTSCVEKRGEKKGRVSLGSEQHKKGRDSDNEGEVSVCWVSTRGRRGYEVALLYAHYGLVNERRVVLAPLRTISDTKSSQTFHCIVDIRHAFCLFSVVFLTLSFLLRSCARG